MTQSSISKSRYDKIAIALHWFSAVLILALFVIGIYMEDLVKGSTERSWWFSLHKSIGLTVALTIVLRLLWRWTHLPPAFPPLLQHWQQQFAKYTHILLYLLVVNQVIAGYLSASFSGYPTKFWGIPLLNWGWKSPELNELFTNIHNINGWILLALIGLHSAATIYHGIHKDGILRRMLPF